MNYIDIFKKEYKLNNINLNDLLIFAETEQNTAFQTLDDPEFWSAHSTGCYSTQDDEYDQEYQEVLDTYDLATKTISEITS
jgi:hypothetical protein